MDGKNRMFVYAVYINIILSVILIAILVQIVDRVDLVTDLYRASINLTCEGIVEGLAQATDYDH